MKLNLDVKKSSIRNASSNVKIAYKNLEEYDKGNYKVSESARKAIFKKVGRPSATTDR